MARGKTYAREFKLDCVRQVASGEKRLAQICCEHYIAESMLLRWRKEYGALDEETLTEVQLSRSEALEQGSLS